MIILDLIVIVLIIFGAFSGKKKGLVGIIVGFAGLILSIILAFTMQSTVANTLYNMGIGDSVNNIVTENINTMLENEEKKEDNFYGQLVVKMTTEDQVSDTSKAVTMFIMKGISFIVIFLIVYIICYILQMILNVVFDLPGLNAINGIGGIVVGGLSVVIKIWILLAILSFLAPLPAFATVSEYIDDTILVKILYNYNLLVGIIKSGLNI